MKKMRREAIPLIVTLVILLGLPGGALGYEYLFRPSASPHRTIDIHMAIPQHGGFGPDIIRVNSGESVTLRFTSDDVTHGVAIGPGLGVDLGQIDPGHAAEVTMTFDHPGQYTYYCNTWCSNDHWRMRGVIEVIDPANPDALPAPERDSVIEALIAEGVDIDLIKRRPDHPDAVGASAEAGRDLIARLNVTPELEDSSWQRTHTPQQALDILAKENISVPKAELMNAVAYLWVRDFDLEALKQSQSLYQKNCAGCHGETGGGDGPGADLASFTPIFSMVIDTLPRRSDVLYAKIRRGGMGTGMPNWGTVFTSDETWGLVDYLWTLAFDQ